MKITFRNMSLITSLIIMSFISYGQNLTFDKIDDLANSKANELLHSKNIDKVLIYSSGCVGCERISLNECECNLGFKRTYLLWKESNAFKILKIDCCQVYESMNINLDDLWNSLNKNTLEIFNSKFQSEFEIVHYSFTDIKLIEDSKILESDIKDYYFDESNRYYIENKKQPINEFQKLVSMKINEFENKKN
jgi:hypothetical protein